MIRVRFITDKQHGQNLRTNKKVLNMAYPVPEGTYQCISAFLNVSPYVTEV